MRATVASQLGIHLNPCFTPAGRAAVPACKCSSNWFVDGCVHNLACHRAAELQTQSSGASLRDALSLNLQLSVRLPSLMVCRAFYPQ